MIAGRQAVVPFPLQVEHYPHEPAHALLQRTAEHNGVLRFSTVYKGLGVDHGRSVHNIDPEIIALKCRSDVAAVKFTTARMSGAQFTLLNQTFSMEHWAGYNRKWCPECLIEAPYHRAWWDLSIITTCTRHGVELVSTCACAKPLKVGLHPVLSCQSEHDLTATVAPTVSAEDQAAELWIMDRLLNGSPSVGVLEDVSVANAVTAMEWLGKLSSARTMTIFEARKAVGQRALINSGFAILQDFPSAYDRLLDRLLEGGKSVDGKESDYWGIERAYGEIVPLLLKRKWRDPDDKLTERLRNRLVEHASENILLKTGTVVSGSRILGLPLKDVAAKCGMSFEVFSRLAGKLGLISADRKRGRPYRIAPEYADQIVARLTSLVTMDDLVTQLGVASPRVLDLVEAGHIAFVDRPPNRSVDLGRARGSAPVLRRERVSNKWLFESDAAHPLLDRMAALAMTRRQGDFDDLIPLTAVYTLYAQVARAVELVLDCELAIRGIDEAAVGLGRFLISQSEAAAAFKRDRRHGNLALRDAAPLMGLSYNQLRGCVKAGLVMPLGKGKAVYLTDDMVQEFKATYVRAAELSEKFGWEDGSKVVIRYLREVGVEPLGGKSDIGVTIYQRDDVEPVASRLPPPAVFTNTRERAAYQKANGLEVLITRRPRVQKRGTRANLQA